MIKSNYDLGKSLSKGQLFSNLVSSKGPKIKIS